MKLLGGILIGIGTGVATLFAYDWIKGKKTDDKPCSCSGTGNGSGTGATGNKPGITTVMNGRPVTINDVTVSRPAAPIPNNGTNYIQNGVNSRFQWR